MVNLFFMPVVVITVAGMGIGTVWGLLTSWAGRLGMFCGAYGPLGLFLVPVGICDPEAAGYVDATGSLGARAPLLHSPPTDEKRGREP